MKNILFMSLVLALLFSCKTTKKAPSLTAKTDRSSQKELKGNWQITNVTYPGSNYIRVNSFQIADSKCFVGSTWNFISNNNKGSMSLNQAGCTSFSSPIVWSINKEGMFGLKILDAGLKSRKVVQGYMLRVANQTETSFQLIDAIDVGGKQTDVVYQFVKTN